MPSKSIYFDSEGHVLYNDVSFPDATMAVFLTDTSAPGPQFKLAYERKDDGMTGKFQMKMPGQASWNANLEWSETKR
jgi:hypothetical protein